MPVPSAISDLSTTAGSNSPAGSDSPTTTDDYLRAHASFLALLRDGKGAAAEITVASGGTTDIGAAASPFVLISGTTTITSFGTTYSGARFVRFSGILTLTHNATTLILPGGANITTAAGDALIAVPVGSPGSGWKVVSYQRADGAIVAATQAQQETGTSTAVYVSPGRQQFHQSAAKAFAVVTQGGGVYALQSSSYNIASISKTGTGVVEVNFTTAFSSVNYAPVASCTSSSITTASPNITSASKVTVYLTRTSTEASIDGSFTLIAYGDQ